MINDRKGNYNQVPLWRGPVYHDIAYGTAIIVAESETDFRITTDSGSIVKILEKNDGVITAPHCIDFWFPKWIQRDNC